MAEASGKGKIRQSCIAQFKKDVVSYATIVIEVLLQNSTLNQNV